MAFHLPIAFASFPKSVQVKSRKTDPLIQCIIDNKPEKLKKKVRRININGLYPSADWEDDVTLLTAAAVCGNEAICNFLLGVNADPNILSRNGLTTLHYAANTPGVPLNIVRRLLAAKASPDGHEAQPHTPLHFAAGNDRLDIVKALIEAGANPERNYGVHLFFNDKVELLINKLPEDWLYKAVEKFRIFFPHFLLQLPENLTQRLLTYLGNIFLRNILSTILHFLKYILMLWAHQQNNINKVA